MSALCMALGGLVAVFLIHRWQSSRGLPPLPPGPEPLPIVGNVYRYPRNNELTAFSEWRKIYGISSLAPCRFPSHKLTSA
ncbi:hypothetical protein BOTBODRAFT_618032 [Botryobasidium botryosum FD-172 SS1]|uniref:Uncharacterized protein n=1 Tax=Botryobasidium botryosum (strain FD-172 SS1) TaxID=930990 RepID=A0A067N2T9_BOTB1|nr:hypothetical protein BOTBODRAFT_618032 [Botryobasidium botryosum FD-172 SS1]